MLELAEKPRTAKLVSPGNSRYFLKVGEDDVSRLRHELDSQPELWGQFGWRKNIPNGPHGGMTDIWVRYNRPETIGTPAFNSEHDSVFYPAWYKLPSLKNIVFPLMQKVEGVRLGGILITKIPPGHEIKPHVDKGWHVDYYDKFYVSVKSSPGALFFCDDEVLNPKVGEIWRFDNRALHWVQNDSKEDRVTLIVCIRTEKYASAS